MNDFGGHRIHPRAHGLTLRDAFRIFVAQRSPRIIATLLLFVFTLRVVIGDFGWADLAVAISFVAVHPFSEWLIHVFVLHFRPRKLGPFTIDSRAGRDHRSHHLAPHDPQYWFIPLQSGLVGFVVIATLARWLAPTPALAVTVMVTTTALALAYEWTHYLCHTSYTAKGPWLRRRQRLHRLHHFKNETYWMGVTMHFGDLVLGTLPDPRVVPTSPTCRTLLEDRVVGRGHSKYTR